MKTLQQVSGVARPRVLAGAKRYNTLDRQTVPKALIEAKRLFGALANLDRRKCDANR